MIPSIHPTKPILCQSRYTPSFNITSLQTKMIMNKSNNMKKTKLRSLRFLMKIIPSLLKEIYQPPWVLFAKGNLSLLEKQPKLAVVGSRQATQYGKNAIRLMFPQLVEKGVVIVSGLATGIDTLAHEYAMKNGGNTIAVIAGGLYHIYPKENIELAREMMKTQLVVSEYPPDTKPLAGISQPGIVSLAGYQMVHL